MALLVAAELALRQLGSAGVRGAAPLVQQNGIGVEEHMRPTLLQVLDKALQMWIEQRLADPVQYRALDPWQLIDDPAELRPGQVMLGLER